MKGRYLRKKAWKLVSNIVMAWHEDKIPRLSAALAYYTIFSIVPLVIIGIAFAGLFFGEEASRGHIVNYITSSVGPNAGLLIQSMIITASAPKAAMTAQIMGFLIFFLGIWGLFGELQSSLNSIWGVKSEPEESWLRLILTQLRLFIMVLVAAFLLLFSVILDISLGVLGRALSKHVIALSPDLWWLTSGLPPLVSFIVTTLLFGLIFKVLPNKAIPWKDIWIGAIVTSILFKLGKYLLGFYLARSTVTSVYGASGSFVAILIWVYYTSQIFLLGAETSKVVTESGHG